MSQNTSLTIATTTNHQPTSKGATRMLDKRILWTLLIIGVIAISTSLTQAQSSSLKAWGRGSSVNNPGPVTSEQRAEREADQQSIASTQDEQGNTLVGVWETVAPALNDCQTGVPDPSSPIIRVLQKFNQDGTMTEENTDPIEGPYRTTAHGIWERIQGRQFRTFYMHYSFAPDQTHIATVKIRSIITLSRDSQHFNEKGTVEVLDPQNNDAVLFTGCFNSGDRPARLQF
jgi:hypothetical protein